ncbi:MAG TPA: SDR family oxidoreductase [Clostridiales bacterium]|nr:SDR family oxidoreductase [Clostridiales bacterium]
MKTVLITGASRGIGRACAIAFAKCNYNVVINYLNSEAAALKLHRDLANLGCSSIVYKADVSNSFQVNNMFEHVFSQFGHVDVLVNNAGISQQCLFTDISEEDFRRMIDVNLVGTFNCCKAVLPSMIKRKSGSIINVSSIWGITGASCEVHYSAAKAGIIGLTKSLAKEVGPSGIRVNCVAPGVIETDMNANLSESDKATLADCTPLLRLGTPEEVAGVICFLASDKASFITGQVISPNGGFLI